LYVITHTNFSIISGYKEWHQAGLKKGKRGQEWEVQDAIEPQTGKFNSRQKN